LVLVRKAASIVPREKVANWLYGVAYQTALKARAATARRRAKEGRLMATPEPAATDADFWRDVQPVLDQELSRLPDKYREPIILCELMGKTRKEVARQLGWPEGTVAGRLARARKMLADRLARRGVVLPAGFLAITWFNNAASASVPASLVGTTIKFACAFTAGQTTAAGAMSPQVAALAEGVLKSMLLAKLKLAAASVIVFVLICSAGILASYGQDEKTDSVAAAQVKDDDEKLKETLLELDKKLWDASSSGETKVVDKLLDENYLSIWAVDDRTDKATTLELIKRYRYSDRTMRDIEFRRVSKEAAVLTYVCSYKVSVDNEAPREVGERRISTVWARREGQWVVVFTQAMSASD
jgi:RNA polymerase sigma factor (sigma-70 family)